MEFKSVSNEYVKFVCLLMYSMFFRVVATQLSADLTKRLVLVDPYRIKCPAEIVEVSYELPLGVQLLQVYISTAEYSKLFEQSSRNRNIFQYLSNKSTRKVRIRTYLIYK